MKKGKKKLFLAGSIFMVLFLVTAVFAAAASSGQAEGDKKEVSADVSNYINDFVEKKGIDPNGITNVSEVNFEDLPKEVSIDNVDDTNLAIYQVDYNKEEESDKLFVITYSVEKLASQGDLIVSQDKREFLNFGVNEEVTGSAFMKMASGVTGSTEKGYIMMRPGSIIGISTNLEILDGNGNIDIIIYKNGQPINFGNSFIASPGTEKDYDVQSQNTVTFEAGDTISVYAKASEGVTWKDATTLLEIVTN